MHLLGDTGVAVTCDGSRYLGGYLGTPESSDKYTRSMVDRWVTELRRLARMAQTQPQAFYAVFTRCLVSRWTYHLRCLDFNPSCLQAMDDAINAELIPALTGHEIPQNSPLREVLSFPARFGRLAIPVLSEAAPLEHAASRDVTRPLVTLVVPRSEGGVDVVSSSSVPLSEERLGQAAEAAVSCDEEAAGKQCAADDDTAGNARDGDDDPVQHSDDTDDTADDTRDDDDPVRTAVCEVRANSRARRRAKAAKIGQQIKEIRPGLSTPRQQLVEVAGEKGVSSWITTPPSRSQPVTIMSKSDFRDAVCIRYDLSLDGV